jgi:hypothetical protein
MSVAGGAARGARAHDVVFVRLVSLEFLERCWEEDELKQLMAPRWSVEGADIAPETVHETISQLARGNIGVAVDFYWHFLGLARLGVRETARQTDEARAVAGARLAAAAAVLPRHRQTRICRRDTQGAQEHRLGCAVCQGLRHHAQTHRGGGG